MYRKSPNGWLKHFDFMLWDLICLQAAFILAYVVRHGLIGNIYQNPLYRNMAIFFFLEDIVIILLFSPFGGVLKRGYYIEFAVTVKHAVKVLLMAVLYLFTLQESTAFSRMVLYLTGIFYVVISYAVRIVWKRHLKKKMTGRRKGDRRLLVITTSQMAEKVITDIRKNNYEMFDIVGLAVINQDCIGSVIEDVPVVASKDTVVDYACKEWVDEVFVILRSDYAFPRELIDELVVSGITVHLNLARSAGITGNKQAVEKIGKYTVLTTSLNFATPKQAFYKRMLDICGGLAGSVVTGMLYLLVAPVIKIQSPGPVFFTQTRVGKNGKKFKMYKFRTMYLDAEERKKELMAQNRIQSGYMFKLDFDPRVIGNRILQDGTQKTGFMDWCRRHSIDEFPQFFNVLKGDMSLVGTRPPTLEEVDRYSAHHYARLATKPGITGLWQVSGRSNIIDFEEVVKLDTKYIREWTIGRDLRILVRTVQVVLKGEGAM